MSRAEPLLEAGSGTSLNFEVARDAAVPSVKAWGGGSTLAKAQRFDGYLAYALTLAAVFVNVFLVAGGLGLIGSQYANDTDNMLEASGVVGTVGFFLGISTGPLLFGLAVVYTAISQRVPVWGKIVNLLICLGLSAGAVGAAFGSLIQVRGRGRVCACVRVATAQTC